LLILVYKARGVFVIQALVLSVFSSIQSPFVDAKVELNNMSTYMNILLIRYYSLSLQTLNGALKRLDLIRMSIIGF